jgi:hypothetical protein
MNCRRSRERQAREMAGQTVPTSLVQVIIFQHELACYRALISVQY